MPEISGRHARQQKPGELENTAQVDIDQGVDIFGAVVEQVPPAVLAGVVDEDVDLHAAEPAGQRGHGDVDEVREATGLLRQRGEPGGVARQRMHREAETAQHAHRRRSDPGRRARDKRGSVAFMRQFVLSPAACLARG